MKRTAYRTRSYDEDLYWSNEDGWVDLQSATMFTISEAEVLNPPVETVAIDLIEVDGKKRKVTGTHKEFPPSSLQKRALIDSLREMDVKAYDEQRQLCVDVLENAAGIQCYDHETLDDLIETVAANINDGTLSCDCLKNAAATAA